MFAPDVIAGIFRPSDLAGYRNAPVYVRRSMHVPPGQGAVRDSMPVLLDLLREETKPSVRVVLGLISYSCAFTCILMTMAAWDDFE